MNYICGSIAGFVATLFSNPFDFIKTRLQVQGELGKKGQHVYYKNTFHGMYVVAKMEGIMALQKGLVPALIYQSIMNGIRLGFFSHAYIHGWTKNKDGEISLGRTIVCSATGGIIASFVGSPFFLVKTQVQARMPEAHICLRHKDPGVISALKTIYEKRGVRGLWRGSTAGLPRIGIASSSQIVFFVTGKQIFTQFEIFSQSKASVWTTLLPGILGGFAVGIIMTPFDIVQTRLYNQAVDDKGRGLRYKGVIDCLVKTFKAEGTSGLFKGVGTTCLRFGPHSTITLITWDFLRKKFGAFPIY